jgi:hypothetical protein
MKALLLRIIPVFLAICLCGGCANVVPPSGGKKDVTPPRLVSVTPPDSQLRTRIQKLELRFDEYIVLNNPATEVIISPLLPLPHSVLAANKKVTVYIPDSLLTDSTTYRISFGKAIQDLHENNTFSDYTYSFSTGEYFDSLRIRGVVTEAATGLPDTGAFILLYSASVPDSAVVSEKPLYVGHTDVSGHFTIDGLPPRPFRLYALQDQNANLMYDGGLEKIAFHEEILLPQADSLIFVPLRTFQEKEDTSLKKQETKPSSLRREPSRKAQEQQEEPELRYQVLADTSDTEKRSFDVTRDLLVLLNKKGITVDESRISLSYDSSEIELEAPLTVQLDTGATDTLRIQTRWKEDVVYTLRLLKGFVTDSSGAEAMPSRYRFRTKWEEDYGKLQVNLPARYLDGRHIAQVTRGTDTVYHQPVTDTVIRLTYLQAGDYTLRLIVDANGNGQWDTGDLFAKRQPEFVIPHRPVIQVKAGWEHVVDFEEKPEGEEKLKRRRDR